MRLFILLELRRLLRDRVTLAFVTAMPLAFYLAFLAAVPAAESDNDRVRLATMVGLAAYGAATASASVVGRAALERWQGWGRQLTMTPLGERGYIVGKLAVAVLASVSPAAIVFVAAALTGVRVPLFPALVSGLVLVAGSALWGLYGLAVALSFRSSSSLALASAGLVLFGFVGEAFVPLPASLAAFARLTPMWGWVALARLPLVGTGPVVGTRGGIDVTAAVVNVVLWSVLMGVVARAAFGRSRSRA